MLKARNREPGARPLLDARHSLNVSELSMEGLQIVQQQQHRPGYSWRFETDAA
jgi:hypothetical protein